MDGEVREAPLREAVQASAEDLGMLPLFLLKNAWALRRGFRYEACTDEQTLAASTRPAP